MTRFKIFVVIAALTLTATANAQIGSGIVFDPTNYKNALLRYLQLQKQLLELQKAYALAQQQTQQLPQLAGRFKTSFSDWRSYTAPNTYGNTSAWVNAVNTGSNPLQAYRQIVPAVAAAAPTEQHMAAIWKEQYGELELENARNIQNLQLIGDLRSRATQNQQALQRLADDSQNTSQSMNTQIAVLNKINVGNVILAQEVQDTNQLLLTLLEQITLQSADVQRQRANALNNTARGQSF